MLLGYALSPFGHRSDAWRQAPDDRLLGFDALLEQVSAADAEGLAFVLLADRLGPTTCPRRRYPLSRHCLPRRWRPASVRSA